MSDVLKTLKDIEFNEFTIRCHDCDHVIGEFHSDNCDEVRCKYCFNQALSCNCKQKDKYKSIVGTPNMDFRPSLINKEELRKEVIKWVKEINNKKVVLTGSYTGKPLLFSCGDFVMSENSFGVIRMWIMYFFNILEEDLK